MRDHQICTRFFHSLLCPRRYLADSSLHVSLLSVRSSLVVHHNVCMGLAPLTTHSARHILHTVVKNRDSAAPSSVLANNETTGTRSAPAVDQHSKPMIFRSSFLPILNRRARLSSGSNQSMSSCRRAVTYAMTMVSPALLAAGHEGTPTTAQTVWEITPANHQHRWPRKDWNVTRCAKCA